MKKKISILLAGVLLAGNIVAFAAPKLTDIDGHWAEKIIVKWVDAEKVNGYPGGEFKPDNNITRGEYVQLLSSLVSDMPYMEEVLYEDVNEEDWYYKAVAKLVTYGVLENKGSFNADEIIKRAEVMTLAGKTFGAYSESELTFSDKGEIDEEALPYVAGLVEMGIIAGYEDNTVRPHRNVTRAEVVKILDGFGLVFEKDSLEGIIDRIYKGVEGFESASLAKTRVDSENVQFFLGLENLDEVEEAIASEPMISSVAHSVCLVRAKEGVDVEALKEKIRTSVDPRKWICVGVDREEIVMANIGNLILMVIDGEKPQEFADSFMALQNSLLPKLVPSEKNILETNGIYMDYMGSLSEASANKFVDSINALSEKYFASANSVTFTAVPSKAYYVNERVETPFDYDKMKNILSGINKADYVDTFDTLSLASYCTTDPHWKQTELSAFLKKLGDKMGFSVDLSTFKVNEIDGFLGQHSKKAEGVNAEKLVYLTNEHTDAAKVEHFTVKDFNGIYNMAKYESKTPYDMFLSGPAPTIKITNENAKSDKSLVIFGDSFANSLAPLLCGEYKTIEMVDLRLISASILSDYVDCSGKDVLLLYSDQIINKSAMLKF